MEVNHNEIVTCDIIRDLMPLVVDGVASTDSEQLVLEHTKHCDKCRQIFESTSLPYQSAAIQPPDDKKILAYIRRRYVVFICLIMMLGAMTGVLFTGTQFMFQNLIIMPIVGALSYICFKGKGSSMAVVVYMITVIQGLIQKESGMTGFGVIYGVLVLVGVAIAALFEFAFSKGKR